MYSKNDLDKMLAAAKATGAGPDCMIYVKTSATDEEVAAFIKTPEGAAVYNRGGFETARRACLVASEEKRHANGGDPIFYVSR